MATLVGPGGCAASRPHRERPTATAAGTTTGGVHDRTGGSGSPPPARSACSTWTRSRGDLTGLQAYNGWHVRQRGDSFAGINRATLKALGATLTE
ncbi:MAG: hypothetical protein IPO80_12950 [Propionibacteriaceae bacterium]|nr:hypothetical protein [Propionibacteriaceae bacterium]